MLVSVHAYWQIILVLLRHNTLYVVVYYFDRSLVDGVANVFNPSLSLSLSLPTCSSSRWLLDVLLLLFVMVCERRLSEH